MATELEQKLEASIEQARRNRGRRFIPSWLFVGRSECMGREVPCLDGDTLIVCHENGLGCVRSYQGDNTVLTFKKVKS